MLKVFIDNFKELAYCEFIKGKKSLHNITFCLFKKTIRKELDQ